MANTIPVGIAYADPDYESLTIGGELVIDPAGVALLTATAGTAAASKAAILGANKNLDVLAVADLKLGAGAGTSVSSTAAELNLLDGTTAGTVVASKALAVGANKELDVLAVADLKLGAGAGTSVTATAAEINKVDGVPYSVTVVVTTPDASGTCDAAFTFKDAAGATIGVAVALPFYLSGVDGLSVTAAITGITAAATPVGGVAPLTTGQSGILVTTAAGLGSVKLNGVAATTYYLTFIGLGGRLIVSPALLTKA